MSTTHTIIGLRGNVISAPEKARATECARVSLPDTAQCKFLGLQYIAVEQIVETSAAKRDTRFKLRDVFLSLWAVLFPDQGRETYRQLEGDDMTPVVAYKSGDCYHLADGERSLATARYLGQAYILAEVWALP